MLATASTTASRISSSNSLLLTAQIRPFVVGVTPHRAGLVLASEEPHGETQVLVLNRHDTEAARSEGRDHLTKLLLARDRGLTNCIKRWYLKSLHPHTRTRCDHPCRRSPPATSRICTWMRPVYGNDGQHRSTREGAIEQQARPLDRPGHPHPESARDHQQWVATCPQRELGSNFEDKKGRSCQGTISMSAVNEKRTVNRHPVSAHPRHLTKQHP